MNFSGEVEQTDKEEDTIVYLKSTVCVTNKQFIKVKPASKEQQLNIKKEVFNRKFYNSIEDLTQILMSMD
jgi:hypothetical protein